MVEILRSVQMILRSRDAFRQFIFCMYSQTGGVSKHIPMPWLINENLKFTIRGQWSVHSTRTMILSDHGWNITDEAYDDFLSQFRCAGDTFICSGSPFRS